MTTQDPHVWPKEAAEIAGCTPEWLRQLANRGELTVTRLGPTGIRLYVRKEVERLQRRRPTTTGGDTNGLA